MSLIGSALLHLPPLIFAVFMLAATVPEILNEPYPIVVVGSTLDTGSNVISLLAPVAGWFAFLFLCLGATVYGIYRVLNASGYCSRLFAADVSKELGA